MKCEVCGNETSINYGSANAIVCGSCTGTASAEKLMASPKPEKTQAMEARAGADLSEHSKCVVIKDIEMSFWSMVIFMVKWVLASIPALLILMVIFVMVVSIFQHLVGGLIE